MRNLDIRHKRHYRRLAVDKEYRQQCMARLFSWNMGFEPDLRHPKRLSERLCALYLRAEDPLRRELVRRTAQMELLRARRQERWIVRTWGMCESFRDVRWKELPERFVLVPDHLPGGKCIVDRTQKGWKKTAKKAIRRWMKQNGFVLCGVPEYASADPRVLIEEVRAGRALSVLCMDGEVRALYWQDDLHCIMDAFGGPLCGEDPSPPERLSEINAFCREISADFPFMKLDLLIGEGEPKCTGLHLFENSAFFAAVPQMLDEELGSMLRIPNV